MPPMPRDLEPEPSCPYCGQRLSLVPSRWFGRAVLSCDQCGDFPDYSMRAAQNHSGSQYRPRVLLVDDSAAHLELYRSMLDGLALPIVCTRGEDAITLALTEPFDVIVLDVLMPGMDGWEVCRRLKTDAATRDVPVVMLTSLDAVDVPARARQLGAVAVLMKPCPVERLMIVLNAVARQRRFEQAR
jgi:CheY-like chemotaxis protein